jgi:hypothetical protein
MFSDVSASRRKQIVAAIIAALVLFLIPFPTELIPEWKLRVVDENNQPLANVKVVQSWKNYTFGDHGFDNGYADENGFVVFPQKQLWASAFSRIVYPPLVALALLAHGSAGTDVSVQVFDKNYFSYNLYWRERETIYWHTRDKLPDLITAGKK